MLTNLKKTMDNFDLKKYLTEGKLLKEDNPITHKRKKEELNQVLKDDTLVDLLKFFSEYYKTNPPLKRLFTSSYKQLEKIKEELPRYQPKR